MPAAFADVAKSEYILLTTITKRYWWHAWWWVPQAIFRGGIDKVHAAIEVTATAPA